MSFLLDSFSDLEGNLERQFIGARWPKAENLRLNGDRLEWEGSEGDEWVETGPGLLEDFVQLRDANVDSIFKYAHRWGVLHLCEHDFPVGHPPQYWPTRPIESHPCPFDSGGRLRPKFLEWDAYRKALGKRDSHLDEHLRRGGDLSSFHGVSPEPPQVLWDDLPRADFHYCTERGSRSATRWEPTMAWQTWANRAYGLLAVVAALRDGKVGTTSDWWLAMGTDTKQSACPESLERAWEWVGVLADCWLGAARVRPWLEVEEGQGQLKIASGRGNSPLFGAIAIQLSLAISGAEGFAICDQCRGIYAPSRKPRAGERHYCQSCRDKKIPEAFATAKYRRKKRRS